MAQVKRTLFVNQVPNPRFDRVKKESDDNSKVSYVVTKAVNALDPVVGQELTKADLRSLINSSGFTVTIVKEKR